MEQIAGFACDCKEVAPGLSLWLRQGESLDWTVVREVIERDGYRVGSYDMTGWTVVDCGAHIGVFSAWCAARGAVRVLAIEPQPQNRAILNRNVTRFPTVQVVPLALGAEEGETQIVWVSGGAHTVAFDQPNSMNPVWPVRQTTLPRLLADYSVACVDLLKMDMEGAEIETLLACGPDVLGRIDRIAMETHGVSATHTWYRDPQELMAYLGRFYSVEVVGNPAGLAKVYAKRKGL